MATSLTLGTSRRQDGTLVLTAVGEIDLSNLDEFTEALAVSTIEAANGGGLLTVDLSAVEYLDSSAINALCARAVHIHLVAHPLLISILTVSGLTELITVELAPVAQN